MKIFTIRQNRRLLFKSYLVIVGGLVVIAVALDFGFARLQTATTPQSDPWINGNMALIETYVRDLPAERWPAAIGELEDRLGFAVRIIPSDEVVQLTEPGTVTQEVFDADGNAAYFRRSEALQGVIQIGPVPVTQSAENVLVKLIPPLFYLSIFILVGLWIWPLIRDLNVLTEAALEFAADYRRPTRTLEKITSLRDLATSLDEMSARIRNLIQGQKELTGALSHEMRTPLTRIKFAMAVIGDKTKVSEELRSIDQDVQELDQLVSTMLDYARLDHPDMEINRQITPMDAWLEQVIGKCRLPNQALHIEKHAPADTVQMDPYLMELALSNLLVNAGRYAEKKVIVRFAADGERCRLSVEDDGQGIPEADRQAVFKAFTRLDNSRNRETGGYGLGLAIVSRIAALHGGSARAEQSDLGGARMVIEWSRGSLQRAA